MLRSLEEVCCTQHIGLKMNEMKISLVLTQLRGSLTGRVGSAKVALPGSAISMKYSVTWKVESGSEMKTRRTLGPLDPAFLLCWNSIDIAVENRLN